MRRNQLPPALERRALTLVEQLVDASDGDTIETTLAGEQETVRARVRDLLTAADASAAMLPTELELGDEADLPVPPRVGPFRLVEQIGAGGMGEVWRGERDDGLYEQTVAIKFLRSGRAALGDRFAAERRILARLEHPGIARLIDGGTADTGVSYLVMEHVAGRHIDEAAAGLPVAERVALLGQAAAAVQFAHARLVVHADLKPSNIIVDGSGRVTLLDFGVARLLDTGEAEQAQRHPMTPAFASPQRRAGAAPLIADDMFALGRILDHLIADVRDPDLSAITGRATAHDEAARYPSVGALIADLGRWRERLPVKARTPTLGYRARKFALRHRLGVVATAAAMVLLAGLALAAVFGARSAETARHRAENRFNEVRALSRFMLFDLYDELGKAPGTVAARARIAAQARRYLDRLRGSPDAPPALRLEVAQGYERLAKVQGVSGVASLGRPSEALRSLDAGERIARALVAEQAGDADAHALLGEILLDRWTLAGENAASAEVNAAARAAFDRALALQPGRADARLGRLVTDKNRAFELIWTENRPRDAIPVLRGALARLDALRVPPALREEAQQLRVHLLLRLGDAIYAAGDPAGSLVPFRQAQALIERELAHGETLAWLARRGEAAWEVSGTLEETDPRAALGIAHTGTAAMQRILSYGPDANAEKWLAILYNQQAQLLVDLGETAAALDPTRRSLAIRERRAALEPDDPRRQRDLAIGLGSAAEVSAKAGRSGDACKLAQRSLTGWNAIRARGRLGRHDAEKNLPEAGVRVGKLCRR